MSKQLKGNLLILLAAFIWGTAFLAQKDGGYLYPLDLAAGQRRIDLSVDIVVGADAHGVHHPVDLLIRNILCARYECGQIPVIQYLRNMDYRACNIKRTQKKIPASDVITDLR